MRGARIGSLIGSIGGLVFVLINAGSLAAPLDTVLRVLGGLAFAAVVWFAVARPRAGVAPAGPPSRRAIRVYGTSVTAMALAIPVGAGLINNVLHRPELTVPWVVLAVGLHFLPFASAFDAPVFARLAWTMAAVAVAGAALSLAVGATGAAWTGVLAGFVLLGFSASGPGLSRERAAVAG